MKVLFVASECAPFVKTGGLADVIGAVPGALKPLGAEARVMLPAYPALKALVKGGTEVWQSADLMGGPATLVAASAEGMDLLLLDAPHLYDRAGSIYLGPDGADWPDNAQRFAALSQVAAEVATGAAERWRPDVVHAHDWQAGLIPAYLSQQAGVVPPTLMTIHNIAFQGLFDPALMPELGLDERHFDREGAEFWGRLGFLKAGLAMCDAITTVSPTYARELMTPEFGMGLEGLLQARAGDLTGILNGIDTDVWNPETDGALTAGYSAKALKNKTRNRKTVLTRFDLDKNPTGPLFCVISRLTTQKGLDLLLDAVPALVARGARLAVLGSGDKDLEAGFVAASHRHPGSVGVIIGYDEPLSHLMQGGSDAILIPSRFEPCGLTQLYGMRYGTLPVVARTGGLADTVIDANEAALTAGVATGVQFAPVTAQALIHAVTRTCDLFAQPRVWTGMMRRAMRHPVGWDTSASAYMDLYEALRQRG
ncbi:glycogen synthase GlgA [Roseobacter ponti]|uniref:Glycogen synthase n=1 Tax=Roseobacter ponti TaxID=1891787 RepID=A0A858SUN3_9RHOB|nr:glycogen synthase GlgA [Roseobacter ponti]QJF51717.1 glycogen synthase GlgA [Roseobacter ponti]